MEKQRRFIVSHAYGSGETDASDILILIDEEEVRFLIQMRQEVKNLIERTGRGKYETAIMVPCGCSSWLLKEVPEKIDELSKSSFLSLLPVTDLAEEIEDYINSDEFDGIYRSKNHRWFIDSDSIQLMIDCHYDDIETSTGELDDIIMDLSRDFLCGPFFETRTPLQTDVTF